MSSFLLLSPRSEWWVRTSSTVSSGASKWSSNGASITYNAIILVRADPVLDLNSKRIDYFTRASHRVEEKEAEVGTGMERLGYYWDS